MTQANFMIVASQRNLVDSEIHCGDEWPFATLLESVVADVTGYSALEKVEPGGCGHRVLDNLLVSEVCKRENE